MRLNFFFKQKTAYEIYQCDWSSDVCSSDLCLPQTYTCSPLHQVVPAPGLPAESLRACNHRPTAQHSAEQFRATPPCTTPTLARSLLLPPAPGCSSNSLVVGHPLHSLPPLPCSAALLRDCVLLPPTPSLPLITRLLPTPDQIVPGS